MKTILLTLQYSATVFHLVFSSSTDPVTLTAISQNVDSIQNLLKKAEMVKKPVILANFQKFQDLIPLHQFLQFPHKWTLRYGFYG